MKFHYHLAHLVYIIEYVTSIKFTAEQSHIKVIFFQFVALLLWSYNNMKGMHVIGIIDHLCYKYPF